MNTIERIYELKWNRISIQKTPISSAEGFWKENTLPGNTMKLDVG